MTNRFAQSLGRPMVSASVMLLLVSSSLVSAAPKLFQEGSSQSADAAAGSKPNSLNAIKTLMSDSGELSVLAKRRAGFLPSRGKKDSEMYGDGDADILDDAERVAFLTEAAKRASGFLPMRGRKSSADFEDLEREMMDKRVSSFMPMRGRKWASGPLALGQPESAVPVASAANSWYPRFYHPVPFAAPAAAGQQPLMYYPVKADSASLANEEQPESIEKRKGMGFFGARGKRSAV